LSIAAIAGIRELDPSLYGDPQRLKTLCSRKFSRITARQWKGCPQGQPFFIQPDRRKTRAWSDRLSQREKPQVVGCALVRLALSSPKEVRAMAIIPEKYLDLLQQKKAFANLATLMPDGTPQVTPVWCDYNDGLVRVNTAKGRVKARNLKKGAPVALAIADPDNPYRYVQIRGRVRLVTEDGAAAHIDSLAKKYLGQDKYPYAAPGEVRLLCEIEPTSASGLG
jgi:PPOX class probable F420-dependent enzyme